MKNLYLKNNQKFVYFVFVEANLVALNEKLLQLNLGGWLQFDPSITHLEFLSIEDLQ